MGQRRTSIPPSFKRHQPLQATTATRSVCNSTCCRPASSRISILSASLRRRRRRRLRKGKALGSALIVVEDCWEPMAGQNF